MFSELVKRYWGIVGLFLLMAFFCRFQGEAALAMILGASLLHEVGHLVVLRILGGTVTFFSASSGGLQIRTNSMGVSYLRESAAVLAGPMTNLAVGSMLGFFSQTWPGLTAFAGANWALGIFNLLPSAPLDGWRFLQLILCWLLGPANGGRIAAFCGGICGAFLSVGFLLLMFYSGGNLWLLPTAAAIAAAGARGIQKDL